MAGAQKDYAIEFSFLAITREERKLIESYRNDARFKKIKHFYDACSDNSDKAHWLIYELAKRFGEYQTLDAGFNVVEIRQFFGKQYLIR